MTDEARQRMIDHLNAGTGLNSFTHDGYPAKPSRNDTVTLTRDDWQAIRNLAFCVRGSRQNVGRQMVEYAQAVIKITDSKKPKP